MNSLGEELFTCICEEPRQTVTRVVRQFAFTEDNLKALYAQVSKFRTFMGKDINNIQDMLDIFLTQDLIPRGLCLVVDDFVGIFWLTDINGLFDASVHYTFFDRRQRGREKLCRAAIKYCFDTFKFHRLSTAVPEYEIKVARYVANLGFTYTGRFRKNRVIQDRLYDTLLYDVLRTEANEWDLEIKTIQTK